MKKSAFIIALLLLCSCTNEVDFADVNAIDDSQTIVEEEPTEQEPIEEEPVEVEEGNIIYGVLASSFGYDPEDATAAFLAALKSNSDTIIIDKKSSDWFVKPLSISNLSNKVLYFEEGVVFRAKPGAYGNSTDRLFELRNAVNVHIIGYGATFKMEKSEYTSGEWRHAISLRESSNISIKGLKILDSGGDGIYIAGNNAGTYSKDILIEDVESLNNRRQGISIISVDHLEVYNSNFSDTKGSLPEAGLDIEPNTPEDRIVNVLIENCRFTNNFHAGIVLALHNLEDSSEPVSITFRNCYLSSNHDPSNQYVATEIQISAHKTKPVKGNVLFENCEVNGSNWGMLYSRKTSAAYHVTFKNCVAQNICKSDNSLNPIFLEVPDYNISSGPLGGFTFDNLYIKYDTNKSFINIQGAATLLGLNDMNGEIFIVEPYDNEPQYTNYNIVNNRNVNYIYTHLDNF